MGRPALTRRVMWLRARNPSRCLFVAIARPQHCARKGAEFSFCLRNCSWEGRLPRPGLGRLFVRGLPNWSSIGRSRFLPIGQEVRVRGAAEWVTGHGLYCCGNFWNWRKDMGRRLSEAVDSIGTQLG